MHIKRNQQGFTIIEVVLVLAIAGLIFLMIFIALPALQRGQRDTGRRNDVSTVASAVNTFKSNNKGQLTAAQFTSGNLQNYIDSLSQYDVSSVTVSTGTATAATVNAIVVYKDRKCGTQTGTATPVLAAGTTNRTAAVTTGLENNGNAANIIAHCQDV